MEEGELLILEAVRCQSDVPGDLHSPVCFFFSFENSESWLGVEWVNWMQTLAAVLILGSVVVELSYLIFGMLESVYEKVTSLCQKKNKTMKKNKRLLGESEKIERERTNQNENASSPNKKDKIFAADEEESGKVFDQDHKKSLKRGTRNSSFLPVKAQKEGFPHFTKIGGIEWKRDDRRRSLPEHVTRASIYKSG